MIIQGLCDFFYWLMELCISQIHIPDLPEQIYSLMENIMGYILDAISLLSLFLNMRLVAVLLPFVILLINIDWIWGLVMWILRKIPFAGIE